MVCVRNNHLFVIYFICDSINLIVSIQYCVKRCECYIELIEFDRFNAYVYLLHIIALSWPNLKEALYVIEWLSY